MKYDKNALEKAMALYAVTDRSWLGADTLAQAVEKSLKGGVTFMQLREKDLDHETFLREALELKALCARYQVPFVINDDVELALLCDADGVHVGQSDMACAKARALLGEDKIIGVSAHTLEEALEAKAQGADYLGVGTMFPTSTKLDAEGVSFDALREICAKTDLPVVAIGGINEKNILQLKDTGTDGVAVVSAIFAAENIEEAARRLRALAEEL